MGRDFGRYSLAYFYFLGIITGMIIITPGHYNGASGASHPNGFVEYPETKKWARMILEYLGSGQGRYVAAQTLTKKVTAINKLCESYAVKVVLEVHFNAAQNSEKEFVGRGSETLYCPGSVVGKAYAENVQEVLAKHYPPSRGVKEGWYRRRETNGPLYLLKKTKCPALIIEPDFIHRADVIREGQTACCKDLAKVLLEL